MERKIIRVSRRKLLIAIIILALIGIIIISTRDRRDRFMYEDVGLGAPMNGDSVGSSQAPSAIFPRDKAGGEPYYPYQNNQPDITDTREYLKTSYSADIKTRDVHETVNDVKNAVRDVEGRVDRFQSSDKSGYVSFAVPVVRFEEFRNTVEKLTHKKLYTENISSENLLSQKQSIEQQTASATSTLADLQKKKAALDAAHVQTLNTLKGQLSSIQGQLIIVRQNIAVTQDQNQLTLYRSQEASLASQESSLKQRIASENSTYTSQNSYLTTQINQYKEYVDSLGKQDTQFMNNIATVNGQVSVEWISWWDMMEKISPIHPVIIIIILILIILYVLYRKNYIPKIEFV
jgi:hypothetical protein